MSVDSLLLKFRDKDSACGVSRETLRRLSKELNMSETMIVHFALARFAREVLPGYEPDEGPLSKADLQWVRASAEATLPKGKARGTKSLL